MKIFNINTLLTVLVGAMVLVSALQTLQLITLTRALSTGKLAIGTTSAVVATNPSTSGSSSAATGTGSLDQLSPMVGGC